MDTLAEIRIERDVMVAMRDGIVLATDVYRPDGPGRYPVLLQRTPYSKSFAWFVAGLIMNPIDAVQRGYVVLVQDVRGRFRSHGEWEPFVNEAQDGYDTVEWAASQEWSSGAVGVFGSSYMGVTAAQALAANPPSLKAALVYLAASNYHENWVYSGGAFELGFNVWWVSSLLWNSIPRLDVDEAVRRRLFEELMDLTANREEHIKGLPVADLPALASIAEYWKKWSALPPQDEYWQEIDVISQIERIQAPLLQIAGWYDNFLRSQIQLHEGLHDRGEPKSQLMVGPWDHEAYLSVLASSAGDRDFGAGAMGGPATAGRLCFQWFNYWLKGEGEDPTNQPGVRYFSIGDNGWHSSAVWPPDGEEKVFFLSSSGGANTRAGDGRLVEHVPNDEPPDSYIYDPLDPVPSVGGRTLHPFASAGGIQDQSSVEERFDVLVYTTPRLTNSLRIAGPISVTLYASSSAFDTDFTAKVVDVGPNGYCANVAEGIIRARYRRKREDKLLEPGRVTEFEIDLWSAAYTFLSGHQVRLEISSSNFPRYSRNLNSTVRPEEGSLDFAQRAVQQVWHGETYSSCLKMWSTLVE